MSRRRARRNRGRRNAPTTFATMTTTEPGPRCTVPGGIAELADVCGISVGEVRASLAEAGSLGWFEFPHGIPEDDRAPLVGYLTIPAGADK